MPKDPIMLLSFVNTQLRDNYSSLSELCAAYCADKADIVDKLGKINYVYDKAANKFV
jgi:hypothetical protein